MIDAHGLEQRQHWLPFVGALMVVAMVIASTVMSLAGS